MPLIGPYSKIVFLPSSKMYLSGNTNINSYSCDCLSPSRNIPLYFEFKENKAIFQNIAIDISTSNINCHQYLYNRNIKKTLDSEQYPYIKVELLEAWKRDGTKLIKDFNWCDVLSKTNITIKNITKEVEVHAEAIRLANNKYRIRGSHKLNMHDFNLDSPDFIFGLIHVRPDIEFHFDLLFELTK